MQISSRFTIAIHVLTAIETLQYDYKITSDLLADSISVNPVVIRRVMQQLKGAGMIEVRRGTGGMELAKPADEITLLDIFNAVDSLEEGQLFHFHENPNASCPVGRNIHTVLDGRLQSVQKAMEDEMSKITLGDIVRDTRSIIAGERKVRRY